MRVAWIALIAGCGFQGRGPIGQGEAAPAPDAGLDAAARCPVSYDVALPGPSRYRLIASGGPAWVQSDACAADLPGATHLVVLDSPDELGRVISLVAAATTTVNAIWVGAVQQATATQPGVGWLWFDDKAVTGGWSGVEPNDRDGRESREEQFVRIEKTKLYLQDSGGNSTSGALCECDGKSIAPAAADAITASRPVS
jgi:hypothetical protein